MSDISESTPNAGPTPGVLVFVKGLCYRCGVQGLVEIKVDSRRTIKESDGDLKQILNFYQIFFTQIFFVKVLQFIIGVVLQQTRATPSAKLWLQKAKKLI